MEPDTPILIMRITCDDDEVHYIEGHDADEALASFGDSIEIEYMFAVRYNPAEVAK